MDKVIKCYSMYLARQTLNRKTHFIIRESFAAEGCIKHRDLVHLGEDPREFIIYTEANAFYVDDWVSRQLLKAGVEADPFELEKLFYSFLDLDLRYRLSIFADRSQYRGWKPLAAEIKKKILTETHIFDRRRLHFLRFGRTDKKRLNKPVTLYHVLVGKSRDEIEQYILQQEMVLAPNEYKSYIYTIFDLQLFFTESFARTMPEALDAEKMDRYFLKQLCKLDREEQFWNGLPRTDRLAEYLVRYVIMYFDYSFGTGIGWEEYVSGFMDSHRRFVPPKTKKRMSMSEVSTVFGLSRAELSTMSRRELKRVFREKARELHPDAGGDHDQFIELADAYNEVMRTKR